MHTCFRTFLPGGADGGVVILIQVRILRLFDSSIRRKQVVRVRSLTHDLHGELGLPCMSSVFFGPSFRSATRWHHMRAVQLHAYVL